MARIYLSYSRRDGDFARLLVEQLKAAGHDISVDFDDLAAGQDWRGVLSKGLKEADAFVVLLSEASLASQYTLMELGTARSYSAEIGRPVIIPVLIDDIPIPIPIQDIQAILAKDRQVDVVVAEIDRALSLHAGREAARETRAEETARKIEQNAASYIEAAVRAQKESEKTHRRQAQIWYGVGFGALLSGILFAMGSFYLRPTDGGWVSIAAVLVTNVIVIGFLGACSRYAFSLGKSYISESLKAADRIHAIAFGEFYLNAFGDRASWAEVKEVFQHWNIDRASAFSGLDVSQIDPQVLVMLGQLAGATKTK